MQLRHSSILVLSFCIVLILTSCSKSLTDIGYPSRLTSNRPDWQDTYRSPPIWPPYIPTVVIDEGNPRHDNGATDNVLETRELLKLRIKFIAKLYHELLSPNVTLRKLERKFKKNCSQKTLEEFATKKANTHPLRGWSAFLFNQDTSFDSIEFSYLRDNTFVVKNKLTNEIIVIEVYQRSVQSPPIVKSVRKLATS